MKNLLLVLVLALVGSAFCAEGDVEKAIKTISGKYDVVMLEGAAKVTGLTVTIDAKSFVEENSRTGNKAELKVDFNKFLSISDGPDFIAIGATFDGSKVRYLQYNTVKKVLVVSDASHMLYVLKSK